ncbi:MAG: type IV pilus assembly protein PilM [Candidatus Omnitrophica bacterium]|nr:type IV pilus assembly protein PilM [Candidatus Omnitrophota bacterium]
MEQLKAIFEKFAKPKAEIVVGLDIGNSSVKVVQLLTQPGSLFKELVSFDIQRFQSPKLADVSKAIKKSLKNAQISSKLVNTSVSGQAVIVRYVQMPKMTKGELLKALKLGLGKYIPFNLNEVNYDFQILGDSGEGKGQKMMKVLLVAVKKEVIEERIKILLDVGLTPGVIDVDSFAIVNSFKLVQQENKGIIAVLDIGADITSITILRNNIPHFNRDIPIGGRHLTKAIIAEFEMTEVEAEELKHDPKDRYGDLISAIRSVLDSIASEIQMSFNYAESQMGGSVQKIFLTGGTAKFKGIDKVLKSILGIDVEIWDPTRILQINPELPKERLIEVGPLLTVSIGLALRG